MDGLCLCTQASRCVSVLPEHQQFVLFYGKIGQRKGRRIYASPGPSAATVDGE